MYFSFFIFWNGFWLKCEVSILNLVTLFISTVNILNHPGGSDGKESACTMGDLGSIPGLGRSPGERKGYPLQYSGLENSMDCIVPGVAKSWTQLSDLSKGKGEVPERW